MTPAIPTRIALIIPTLNAGAFLDRLLPAIAAQSLQPGRFLIIDSSSRDNTVAAFKGAGAETHQIQATEFDHGATRQMAVDMLTDSDVVIFLTQDAVPAGPETFARLLAVFEDPKVGAAFGRQLPHSDSTAIGAHARLFNYPAESNVRTLADAGRYGIKTAFCSNSFAAYRRRALVEAGGFPKHTIFGEDMLAVAAILEAGWKKHYVADACVYHAHDYSLFKELQRYFDVGVMHRSRQELFQRFGRPEGEGRRFVRSELSYLWANAPWLVPSAVVRTGCKYLGYRLGLMEGVLPDAVKPRLSMNRGYWRR